MGWDGLIGMGVWVMSGGVHEVYLGDAQTHYETGPVDTSEVGMAGEILGCLRLSSFQSPMLDA